jgi:hypothetical protein
MKTISKYRVLNKLKVIAALGSEHVILGEKYQGVVRRFFVVRNNFESVLQSSSSVEVDAEVQCNGEVSNVQIIRHSDAVLLENEGILANSCNSISFHFSLHSIG